MKKRFGFTLLFVLVTLSMLLSACGPQATAAPKQEAPAAAQATATTGAAEPAAGGAKNYVQVPKNLVNP